MVGRTCVLVEILAPGQRAGGVRDQSAKMAISSEAKAAGVPMHWSSVSQSGHEFHFNLTSLETPQEFKLRRKNKM